MSSEKTTLYAGIVIALIVGAAVGYFVYPSMNPGPVGEWMDKADYDAVVADLATAETQIEEFTKPKKVGLILATGGLGDKSFNDLTYAGVMRAKDELGIEFDYVQPTAIAEYEGYQRDFASSGDYFIIICQGFDQADALTVIAAEYPDQAFALVDMVVSNENVASLTFRQNEGGFLLGVVAGMTTETGSIGFVGGMEIPLIMDFYLGYKAGAEWANPAVTVAEPVFVGGWGDPSAGKELAITLIEQGNDGLFEAAGGSGLGVLEAAHEQGVIGYGVDACMDYLHDEVIASATKRVDEAVYEMILSALVGQFQGGYYSGGLAEGWVGMCRLPNEEPFWEEVFDFEHDALSEDIMTKVKDARDKIIAGDISVPSGFG